MRKLGHVKITSPQRRKCDVLFLLYATLCQSVELATENLPSISLSYSRTRVFDTVKRIVPFFHTLPTMAKRIIASSYLLDRAVAQPF